MLDFDKILDNEKIKEEYKKTFLLNLFRKLCVRMNKNDALKKNIKSLFLQSYNEVDTTKLIIKREFDYEMSLEDSKLFNTWLSAYLRKSTKRKTLSLDLKKELYKKQNGICAACGEALGSDWSKIHVDHIIPFKLVGDELDDNYQDLCDTCNECKSARIDYIFKAMIKLN